MIVEKTRITKNWDEELKNHNGSLFLSKIWLESLRSEDCIPVYLVFKEGNTVIAMLGGLVRPVGKGPEKQLFFFSGIATRTSQKTKINECKSKLLEYAKKYSYSRIILKSYDSHSQNIPYVEEYFPLERVEYVINLDREKEEIVAGFAKRYRRYINKARKLGAIFRYGYSEELLDRLIHLMESTRESRISKGYGNYEIFTMPFLNRKSMLILLSNKAATIFYIEYLGEIVSIQFVLELAGRAYGLYMGTNSKGYEISAPSVLYYEIAFACKEKGEKSYNLGGVPLGEGNKGINRIKQFMGADKVISNEEVTDFLAGPVMKLNKYLWMKRFLNRIRIPWKIKKRLIRITDIQLNGMDRY